MRTTPIHRTIGIGLALALVAFSAGGVAASFVESNELSVCVAKDGSARFIKPETGGACDARKESLVSWNVIGPSGPAGETGAAGPAGPAGPAGGGGGASVAFRALVPGQSCTDTLDFHAVGVGCPGAQGADQDLQAVFSHDPADYPAGAAHALDAVVQVNPGMSYCVRLFNVTTQTAVLGSEACLSNSTTGRAFYPLRTVPTGLSAGTYVLQAQHSVAGFMSSGSGSVTRADLVIDWE